MFAYSLERVNNSSNNCHDRPTVSSTVNSTVNSAVNLTIIKKR